MSDDDHHPKNHHNDAVDTKARCIDYNRPHIAEQEAAKVVGKILHEAAQLLYHRYLERKAFPFATDAAVEAAIAGAQMCFVPCENGEIEWEEWVLEEEPEPAIRDSWAGMCLPKKEEAKMRSTFASSKDSFGGKKRRMTVQKVEPPKERSTTKSKSEEAPRYWSVEEKGRVDRDEEHHRELKFANDAKKREKEKKARDEKKAAETERIRIEALHEEMEKRPHTFDLQGNVLWVEPVNLAKLPQMAQMAGYMVKKDKRDKESVFSTSTTKIEAPPKPKPKPPKNLRRKKKGDTEFPDGFTPLAYQQPPLLETMNMKPGVKLEHKGKNKTGPASGVVEGKMSRTDYNMLLTREISGDTMLQFSQSGGVRAVGGNSGNPVESSSPSNRKNSGYDDPPSPNGRNDSLPALDKGRPPPPEGARSPSKGSGMVLGGTGAGVSPKDANALAGGKEEGKKETLPLAPSINIRRRCQFDGTSHLGRPPRMHPPLLGKLNVYSGAPKATQPPLGATMGHGLLRTESSLEEYFFPAPFSPEQLTPALLMPRSKSDSALPRDSDVTRLPPSAFSSPKNAGYDAESYGSPIHGDISPELKSPAYRNFRAQLFPPRPGQTEMTE